jgi:hypothetical protein
MKALDFLAWRDYTFINHSGDTSMKTRRLMKCRLWVEELEPRVVLSTTAFTYSSNWSGYAVQAAASTVSDVKGSWTVPDVATTTSGYSSFWVGIDGYNSSSVEQIGTGSDYVNGVKHFYAWYEMYPAGSNNITVDNNHNPFTVQPSDTISAEVAYTAPNQYNLTIIDSTSNHSFTTTQTANAQRSSAEWIAEAPSSGSILPLANFGTVAFTSSTATINNVSGPISTWNNYNIDMATKTSLKDETSALGGDGASFTVQWLNSGVKSGGGHGHARSHTNADGLQDDGQQPTLATTSLPMPAPARSPLWDAALNAPTGATFGSAPAFQQHGSPAFFQGGTNAGSDFRQETPLGADLETPAEVAPSAPRPQVQPAPMLPNVPNRANPPVTPAPMNDLSSNNDGVPVIVNVNASTADAPAETRQVRTGGLLKAFVGMLGVVGAFTLFHGGCFLTRSRTSEERERFERDRLAAK